MKALTAAWWVSGVIATAILSPVLKEIAVSAARRQGWIDDPAGTLVDGVAGASSLATRIVGLPWYPYLAGGVVGFGLGVLTLHMIQRRKHGQGQSVQAQEDRLVGLANDIGPALAAISRHFPRKRREGDWLGYGRTRSAPRPVPPVSDETLALVRSTLVQLEHEGVETPQVSFPQAPQQLALIRDYLQTVRPFLSKGQVEAVRREAAHFVAVRARWP